MNKILLFIIFILTIIFYSSCKSTTIFNMEENNNIFIKVKNNLTDEIEEIELEDYVIGVVAGEMPASFETEALKAQAIAARTYALYKKNTTKNTYDVTQTTSDQVYLDKNKMQEKWQDNYQKYYNIIKQAVLDTKDLVLKYNNDIICSYYFAISNGTTEDVKSVFGESVDYLKSVTSPWDMSVKNYEVKTIIPKKEFCSKLKIDCKNIVITNIYKNKTNHVDNLKVNNKIFKGTEIRKILTLRSTDFDIIQNNDDVVITTKGYGHGVGMSQYGANELAKLGKNYIEILKYYYQNTNIEKISV